MFLNEQETKRIVDTCKRIWARSFWPLFALLLGADIDGICRHIGCRVQNGQASIFGLVMKLVVEYKVEWIGYYLTFCASISTVVFEELLKRVIGGCWFPVVIS